MAPTSFMTWRFEPVFFVGIKAAVPCATCTAAVQYLHLTGRFGEQGLEGLLHHSAFGGFTLLISLFVSFRASHAYARFSKGSQSLKCMSSALYKVASMFLDFSRHSKGSAAEITQFRQLVVGLCSMLHALILVKLEAEGNITGREKALEFEIIDVAGIDDGSQRQLKQAGTMQIDLVFKWLRWLLIDGEQAGLVVAPAPVFNGILENLYAVMMESEKASSLAEIPFPLPYTLATHFVLALHWIFTPIIACNWSDHVWSAALLAGVQVFMLWSLNSIAHELENPFGGDRSDLDTRKCHHELNDKLLFLLRVDEQKVPTLSHEAVTDSSSLQPGCSRKHKSLKIFFSEIECAISHTDIELPPQGSEPDCCPNGVTDLQMSQVAAAGSVTYDTRQSASSDQAMLEWQGCASIGAHQVQTPYDNRSVCTCGPSERTLPPQESTASGELQAQPLQNILPYEDLPSVPYSDEESVEVQTMIMSHL